jgi:CDP-glucose 4,6-dehydratase
MGTVVMTDFWRSRRVFVTGATGFLGGWMVKALFGQGAEVTVLLRDGAPKSDLVRQGLLSQITVINGSLDDVDLLRRALAEYSIQTVFHLAAQTQVGVAKLDPVGTLEANIRGTWNLLEAARLLGGIQIVAASSDKAYGDSATLPYDESHPLQGRFPYDVSKSCMDLVCRMYAATYGLPVGIARCANLFGGGDMNFARLIPGAIRATLAGEPFVIRSDGQFVRDYLYVEDAVEAYMVFARALDSDCSLAGQAFNFGLGGRYTVFNIVDYVIGILGRMDLRPVILNQASAEIREQVMSSEKARRILDWSPRHDLHAGLEKTVAAYRSDPALMPASSHEAMAAAAG